MVVCINFLSEKVQLNLNACSGDAILLSTNFAINMEIMAAKFLFFLWGIEAFATRKWQNSSYITNGLAISPRNPYLHATILLPCPTPCSHPPTEYRIVPFLDIICYYNLIYGMKTDDINSLGSIMFGSYYRRLIIVKFYRRSGFSRYCYSHLPLGKGSGNGSLG